MISWRLTGRGLAVKGFDRIGRAGGARKSCAAASAWFAGVWGGSDDPRDLMEMLLVDAKAGGWSSQKIGDRGRMGKRRVETHGMEEIGGTHF